MQNSILFTIVYFIIQLVPITLFNLAHYYFADTCEPKFGCAGTFQVLTFIAAVCSLIASAGVLLSHKLFVDKRNSKLSNARMCISLLVAGLLGLSTYFAVALMEVVEIAGTVVLYFSTSFAINTLIFNSKKI